MARSRNPFAFTPIPVTILTSAIYIAAFAVLLVVHHSVPSGPSTKELLEWSGVNATQAWLDLKILSKNYHPYNSEANLEVRAWLVGRVGEILDTNNVTWSTEERSRNPSASSSTYVAQKSDDVVVLDDKSANITFPDSRHYVNYFEGDNLMVYIRGSEDPAGRFWVNGSASDTTLILVNAHYDSVSTGFGATDDGGGVVSILQLISHFTSPGNTPKHGIVTLLNDGEEDGLYGAYAYTRHPISKYTKVFLNLEGAGAGGRATLFRSTDVEVTAPYAKSTYPFGTVISADGFKRGLVRSSTDYSVFQESLDMRGLDVAYMGPRARYHTDQDDAKDSSRGSVWHMLSAALATTSDLATKDWTKGESDSGVWFDLFGRVFAVLRMHTLFALSVTLLVVGPISLALVEVLLRKRGKWYPFSLKTYLHGKDDDEPIKLYGLRGFFRFPVVLVASTAAVVALAYLIAEVNPYIIYSSPYIVWIMMLGAHMSVSWFLLKLISAIRPTALSRLYNLFWLYIISWILLVGTAVVSNRFDIGGGYFLLIFHFTVLLALHISYLELFALPTKSQYAAHVAVGAASRRGSATSRPTSSSLLTRPEPDNAEDANERTALLSPRDRPQSTFARYGRRASHGPSLAEQREDALLDLSGEPYEDEQTWSAVLPRWTWILQIILLLPLNLILIGQIALLLTSALGQTPADGSDALSIYFFVAILTTLLLVPCWPFLVRFVWHVPTLLFFFAVGAAMWNVLADPFTREARLKTFFVQRVDLETGENRVVLNGLPGWVERVVSEMPSSGLGTRMTCTDWKGKRRERESGGMGWGARRGLRGCWWNGLEPDVLSEYDERGATAHRKGKGKKTVRDWVEFKASKLNTTSDGPSERYLLQLKGLNTRQCRIYFEAKGNQTIRDISVLNACPSLDLKNPTTRDCAAGRQTEPDFIKIDRATNQQIRFFSRTFDETFRAVIELDKDGRDKLEGEAVCVWSDSNRKGVIPALDELRAYTPVWATVTKNGDGLVEGVKRFAL